MTATRIVYLMFHELEMPGRALCSPDSGYVRYVVHEAAFRSQISWLKDHGWTGMSVGQALEAPRERSVAITFDDGTETDLILAARLLRQAGFQATFYITVGFLGKRGYLSLAQLRVLAGLGFEIGCHSMTHPYLSDLDSDGLHREIVEARLELEQILGVPVNHFACPGGSYNERAREVARNAGYVSVATSNPHANSASSDRLALGRVVIMRDTPLPVFGQVCRGEGLWKRQLRVAAYQGAKRVLGSKGYDRLRTLLLGGNSLQQQ
jgi:peptidoglycan/xylan/chitin deacetylase (PgdA/CDA1 family)